MNYLTNYYKNICEQLQEQVNILEGQLNELRSYSDKEREDSKLADRDIRAAKMLKNIAAKFNAEKAGKMLDADESNFANRLISMLGVKGIKSELSKGYENDDKNSKYGDKGKITTPDVEELGKIYNPTKHTITPETAMSMLGYDEETRKSIESSPEYWRKEKFTKLRAQQAKEAEEKAKAERKKKFTI